MIEQHAVVAEILPSLLSEHTYELGARLKQRIQKFFLDQGMPAFDPRKEGFPKFSVYLERLHSDIAKVVRIAGNSDVHVYRQHSSSAQNTPVVPINLTEKKNIVIRSDVWQAFVNQDLSRKRFYNKKTCAVMHFIPSSGSSEENLFSANPEEYVEISPVLGEEQLKWMREFLDSAPIGDAEKDVIAGQLHGNYSSALNATFINSLGKQGSLWRRNRIPRIISFIEEWAGKNEIPFSELCAKDSLDSDISRTRKSETLVENFPDTPIPPRALAHKLLDLMTEDDIARTVLPAMMNTLLFKSHL